MPTPVVSPSDDINCLNWTQGRGFAGAIRWLIRFAPEDALTELVASGLLIPRGAALSAAWEDATDTPSVEQGSQATFLHRVDDLIEALSRRLDDEAYARQVEQWANELREELRTSPRLLQGQVDEVYDGAYAELGELERRLE